MAKAARSEDHEMFLTIGIGAKHGQFVTRTNNEAFDMGIVESDSSQGRLGCGGPRLYEGIYLQRYFVCSPAQGDTRAHTLKL